MGNGVSDFLVPKLQLGNPRTSKLCLAIEDEAELQTLAFPSWSLGTKKNSRFPPGLARSDSPLTSYPPHHIS